MSELHVTGFDVVELLGYGSDGEVWLARDRATGSPVALKRLRAGAELAARDRLRREAAVLAGVDHPHVVRLRSVVGDGDGLVLVLDLAPGGSLARLLATRTRLAPGEVVTVAVPLAQALAVVHGQGLVHGDVTPANVLFAADGRPLLSDLGVSRLLGAAGAGTRGTRGYLDPAVVAGDRPGPAADVHGLAATCLAALTGAAPYDDAGRRVPLPPGCDPALVGALESAMAPDPADRPHPAELAAAVFETTAAAPVRLDHRAAAGQVGVAPAAVAPAAVAAVTHQVDARPRPVPLPEPLPRRRLPRMPGRPRPGLSRPPGRVALAAGAAGTAVVLAAVTGVAWAGAGDDPASPAPGRASGGSPAPVASASAAPTAAPDPAAPTVHPAGRTRWVATLSRLDQQRSRAFAAGEPARLREVYAPASPAFSRDAGVLGRLADAGLRARGLRLTATRVEVTARSGARIRLAVSDVMPPYRLVDAAGTVVERRSGRGLRSWTVVLTRVGRQWRVYDVARG